MSYNRLALTSVLPYGQQLRSLLWSSSLTESDLRKFLRKKGIFVNYSEKKDLIPLLTSTILAPRDFEELKEMHTYKQEVPKRQSTVLKLNHQVNFSKIIDPSFDLTSLIDEEFSTYSFLGVPTFAVKGKGKDTLELSFEVEHYDPSRNWFEAKTVSKGFVSFKADSDGYRISSTQTSKEANEVNKRVISYVKKQLREAGILDTSSKEFGATFTAFSNEDRIAFFLDILYDSSSSLHLLRITDLDVKPVEGVSLPESPELKWMQDRIKQLRLHGTGLENTFFIDSRQFHSCLLFPKMEALCSFNTEEAEGTCSLTLQFSDFPRKLDSDLEIIVSIKTFTPKISSIRPQTVRDQLLDQVDKVKTHLLTTHYQKQNPK